MSKTFPSNPAVPLLEALKHLRESFVVTDAELDPPGPRILYANPAFTRMTGYSPDELEGKTPRILQGPESDWKVLDRLRSCLEAGESFEGETVNYRKDGTPFVMRWYIEPIRSPEGEITHYFAIQRDMTAEREASKDQRVLKQAIHQLSDAVVLFGRDGRVRYVNQAYRQWSRIGREEVIGKSVWNIVGAPELREDLIWARRRLGLGQVWQREYAVKRRFTGHDQRIVLVTVSSVRDETGAVVEYLAMGRDITGRRRLESIVEAHNFHDNLGFVFSGIRHELGNPVNSIKTALHLIKSHFETMSKEKVGNYLERILEEVSRVEYLLSSLRSYSLYDQIELEALDIQAFIKRFYQLVHKDLESQGVIFELDLDPESGQGLGGSESALSSSSQPTQQCERRIDASSRRQSRPSDPTSKRSLRLDRARQWAGNFARPSATCFQTFLHHTVWWNRRRPCHQSTTFIANARQYRAAKFITWNRSPYPS